MTLSYKFDLDENYLVAVSFGPDSMALLDLLLKNNVHVIVCHVNYHKRDVSNSEAEALKEYCAQRNITFEYLDTEGMVVEGNFQEWAREIRYDFFERMYNKYDAAGIVVAHHQDDLIETYLIQKNRKPLVKQYGLNGVSKLRGMTVIRPLLNYTKEDLLEYNLENCVPFSMDMSNFETNYLRNQIRRDVIAKLSPNEREAYLEEIFENNVRHKKFLDELKDKVQIDNELDIREIIALTKEEFQETINQFVETSGEHIDISSGRIEEIRKMCLSNKPNIAMDLGKGISIVKEYDVLVLSRYKEIKPYSYTFDAPTKFQCPEFEIDFTDGALDRNIKKTSYPITIRSPKQDDEYFIGDNRCHLTRLFIDWKMPLRLRRMWPVVVDKNGSIIYIPRYRKNYAKDDGHTSKFVIKIT